MGGLSINLRIRTAQHMLPSSSPDPAFRSVLMGHQPMQPTTVRTSCIYSPTPLILSFALHSQLLNRQSYYHKDRYSNASISYATMMIPPQQSWQDKAAAKVAETKSKIPREWILPDSALEDAKHQRQLSGPFIEKFLDEEELEIIRNDSVPLVAKIMAREYTALQVTRAYCKTAAMAHQIVSQH